MLNEILTHNLFFLNSTLSQSKTVTRFKLIVSCSDIITVFYPNLPKSSCQKSVICIIITLDNRPNYITSPIIQIFVHIVLSFVVLYCGIYKIVILFHQLVFISLKENAETCWFNLLHNQALINVNPGFIY